MSWIESAILGLIQGLTEFLPVSSSGHLVLVQYLFGLREPMLAFDVLLHSGTLVAVLLFYRSDLSKMAVSLFKPSRGVEGRKLLGLLIVATIPTAILGFLFKDLLEKLFADPLAVGYCWVISGAMLLWGYRFRKGLKSVTGISWLDAVLIGIFQAIAIVPAISRSGATIFIGMVRGMKPKDAADFSFLLSIPAILGAMLVSLKDLTGVTSAQLGIYAGGALISAVVGYISIWFLIRLMIKAVIRPFGWYCIGMGVFTMIFVLSRG